MTPVVNRREALGALGVIGAAAAAATATSSPALASHVEYGRYARRQGVHGRMTGAQAAAAALRCEQVRCVFGVPAAQNNELWDAFKAYGQPYFLVANEFSASIMADASARVSGEVGVYSVVPGPGLTNAMSGIGEALYDSVPIVGLVTDVDRRPGAPIGQVHGLPNEALLRPLNKAVLTVRHQAEIPGAVFEAFRIARAGEPGPTAVLIPFPLFLEVWDYDQPAPPPYPIPFDEAAYRSIVCHLQDRSRRVGIYAGLGCAEAGPSLTAVAEMLQAPVATSVSGKGCIPDAHPLAVGWGYGKQGTRAAETAFKDVDLVLAIGVRYSEVSTANYAIPKVGTLIHVDANPRNLGRNVPAHVCLCTDSRVFLDRLLAEAASIRRTPCPPLWQKIQHLRQVDRCEAQTVRIDPCVDPMYFLSQLRAALGPEELIFVDVTASTHWAAEAIEVQGPRRFFTPANNQSMGWAIPAAVGGAARPSRSPGRLRYRRWLLPHERDGDVLGRPRRVTGEVLRPRRWCVSLHADAPGASLPAHHGHGDCPHQLPGIRAGRWPGVQPDCLQCRRAARHPAHHGTGRPDPHPRHRELRGPRDPVAQRLALALHQRPEHRPEGSLRHSHRGTDREPAGG